MARVRRAGDWERDLAEARAGERTLSEALRADPRLQAVEDHTEAFDRLDFTFTYGGGSVELDLKEKKQAYSRTYSDLWPEAPSSDLFILDEIVYRRIVWRGGGGYLAVHDKPVGRWVLFGPWELTLSPRKRFVRLGDKGRGQFGKGKLLLNLAYGDLHPTFSVDRLLAVVDRSRLQRDEVGAVPVGPEVPVFGATDRAAEARTVQE